MEQTASKEPQGETRDEVLAEARMSAQIEDFDRARDVMARAIDTWPRDPELHAEMAWFTFNAANLQANERDRLASHHIAVALEYSARCVQAHYRQGMILAARGNVARARTSFLEALRFDRQHRSSLQEIAKLDGNSRPISLPSQSTVATKKRRTLRPAVVVVCLSFIAAAAVASTVLVPGSDTAEWEKKLGTRFSLMSASQSGKNLYLDTGTSWHDMDAAARTTELKMIAVKSRELAIADVYVYSGGIPVAEIRDSNICADALCRSTIVNQPVPGGEQLELVGPSQPPGGKP